jgi:hypothetical protein
MRFLIDWTVVSQYVLAFIGGSGLTGLITAFYEFHVRSKEKAREYFRELVLREEFFKSLTSMIEFYHVCVLLRKLQRGEGGDYLTIDGKMTEYHTAEELRPVLDTLASRIGQGITKERESGAVFLMPRKVREAYDNLLRTIPHTGLPIDDVRLEVFNMRLLELSDALTKALGIAKLG